MDRKITDKEQDLELLLEPSVVKAKFNITDDNLQLLKKFGETYSDEVDGFIDEFYKWMQALPEFPQFFTNSALVLRVKNQQIKYWHEFFNANITVAYLKNRVHIGTVHAEIGLPIHSYCAAMNFSSDWWKTKIETYREHLEGSQQKNNTNKIIAELHSTLNKLIQLDITIVTETYHQSTQKRLQQTLDETQRIVHDVTNIAQAVVKGDFSAKLSDDTNLNIAINQMIASLNDSAELSKRDGWIKTGQATLAEELRGDLDITALCNNAIKFIANYIGAKVGVFYLMDGNKLKLQGSYAYNHRKHISNEFELGEGLIGQAVLEKQTMIVDNLPDDYLSVNSGLGEATAASVIVSPIISEGVVKGVIELGSFQQFDQIHVELLEVVNESIAVALNSAQNREKMQLLLSDSQTKSQELEAQSKVLEDANKDLEDKAHRLKASEDELKSQSEELQATNEELEEKTQALEGQKNDIERQNAQLEKSQQELEVKAKQLQESSKYKSEFLSNMSHELRTPLNSLLILSQMLLDNNEGNLNSEQLESAAMINASGNDLLNLINDILDLSKVEVGKMTVDISRFSPADIIQNLFKRMKPLADNKTINMTLDIASDIPEQMQSDVMRIEQIIKNLLSNAIKFTNKNGDVEVNVYVPEDKQQHIAFAVQDNGIGIAEEDQARIFEAFQQADGTTSRKYGGTGLGLTISKQLSKLLGGDLYMESEENKGSTLTLIIPTKLGEAKSTIKPSAKQSVANKPKTKSSNKDKKPLILIIEDEKRFRKILEDQLDKRKLKYIGTESGKDGFEKAKTLQPSGIILDIGLPDMSGLELLEMLQKDPDTKHIPIHVISASDQKEETLSKGALGFISKPFDKSKMNQLLDSAAEMICEPMRDVLIVEDDKVQREAIKKIIENDNINIIETESGEETITILQSKRIHCMILDLNLTDMTGEQLLKKISEDKEIIVPPVVIHTAKDISPEEEAQLSQYAPSIVLKSADAPQRLIDEISVFLQSLNSKSSQSSFNVKENKVSSDSGNKTVLLVDDDMRNNIALAAYLRKLGFNVISADNGELALQRLVDNEKVDLVLMDIMMPVLDGYSTMQRIRENPGFESLPIIALTAKAMAGDRVKCIDAGANDYLTKPVDTDKLVNTMNLWL